MTNWRKSVRTICRELVTQHSTDIMMRLTDGLKSVNPKTALKFISFIAAYESGKPVETHRMVGLQDGPDGTYDLTRLSGKEQRELLKLLRKSRDSASSTLPPSSPDVDDDQS